MIVKYNKSHDKHFRHQLYYIESCVLQMDVGCVKSFKRKYGKVYKCCVCRDSGELLKVY